MSSIAKIVAVLTFILLTTTSAFCTPPVGNFRKAHASLGGNMLQEARKQCDEKPLSGVEGIWQFPLDGIIVSIFRNNEKDNDFTIRILQSDNSMLKPGQIVGQMMETASSGRYILYLYSDLRKGQLRRSQKCLALYNENKESLMIQKRKYKISFNPLGFLPYFWRSIRIKKNDPANSEAEGLIKVYPGYDYNGSTRRRLRYL